MAIATATALLEIDPINRVAIAHLRRETDKNDENGMSSREADASQELQLMKTLEEDYPSLKLEAKMLQVELDAVFSVSTGSINKEEILSNLSSISKGNISSAISMPQPVSVRKLARKIMTSPGKCTEIIVEDFEAVVCWASCHVPRLETDAIREKLVKRKTLLQACLSDSMEQNCVAALTQIEREYLQKKYVNSETMLGGKIEDISNANFFVSEDNYAWDMEELASAIASNNGVMRNPLSKQMFSDSDIRAILTHPFGQPLKPLQLAQNKLRKGVRPRTIDMIEILGRVMLNDQSMDTAPSRQAMDEFLAYTSTLPEAEQKTLNELKIPGIDGYTGQPFDYSIGESMRDAKANTTCLHKVSTPNLDVSQPFEDF
jgi:hypothetical protein